MAEQKEILVPAKCLGKGKYWGTCGIRAMYKTQWNSTLCETHYDELKDLITANESSDYNWDVCSNPDCTKRSYNTVYNVAFPSNEQWLCEKHWLIAKQTDTAQELPGGITLCNICHRPIPNIDGFLKNSPSVHTIDNPIACYLVIPAVVSYEPIPDDCAGCHPGENWNKLEKKKFVICTPCFDKTGITPETIPCEVCGRVAIKAVRPNGWENSFETEGVSWFCEDHLPERCYDLELLDDSEDSSTTA